MALSLEQLLTRRNAVRTRSNNAIATTTNIIDDLTQQQDVALLQAQVDILTDIRNRLDEFDQEILSHLDDADAVEKEVLDAGQIQDTLVVLLAKTRKAVSVLEQQVNQVEGDQESNHSYASCVNVQRSVQARLPALTLPTFTGEPLSWSSFWDSFESSVHLQQNLSDVDKFNYLRSLLKGIALTSISGLAVTNANYIIAINLIKQRFGQPQAIINAHVEALVNLPKASDETTKLRSLYDAAEVHIRSLATLGIIETSTGAILTPILLSKMPDEIRLIITRKNDGPIGDLEKLRELLRVEIEVREMSNLTAKKQSDKQVSKSSHMFTTGAMISQTSSPPSCPYCKSSNHNAFNCTTHTTPQAKRQKAMGDKLCLNCLRPGHVVAKCLSKSNCKRCRQRHHTSLCFEPESSQSNRHGSTSVNTITEDPGNHTTSQTVVNSQILLSNSACVWMQTALVTVSDEAGNRHTARILFDTGSHRSYVTESLASKLSLTTSHTETLKLASFGGNNSRPQHLNVTNIECSSLNSNSIHRISTIVVPRITCPIYRTSFGPNRAVFQHLTLADPPFQHNERLEIDILVELDHYWELVQDQVIRYPEMGFTAIASVFGWLVSGSQMAVGNELPHDSTVLFTSVMPPCDDQFLTKFWDSESLDKPYASEMEQSEADAVLARFEQAIQLKDGRYEVGLPWKDETTDLPSNYQLCRHRFTSLVHRLNRENLTEDYAKVISQQSELGFIETVEDPYKSNNVHYIPHHPVIKQNHATTNLRLVYDASARRSPNDPSLNDSIYSGPNLVTDLLKLLLQFRTYEIVMLADVEKAFLQIRLREMDRDYTRFFWLKDVTQPPTDDNMQIWRFCRVPFGATSSPFLFGATLRYYLDNCTDPAVGKMKDRFYVDNLITGVDTVDEALEFYKSAKEVMARAGINLREWISNHAGVNAMIPEADRVDIANVKVLGTPWMVSEDVLHLMGVSEMSELIKPTKRQILQTIAKVFDPLGMASPVVITAKMFIQSLWKLQIAWDESPPDTMVTHWRHINKQLASVSGIKVQRHVFINPGSQLHVFVDASKKAYAAVAYIRTTGNGQTQTQFLICKSRVSSIKPMSIPRLELLAACLGCQLASSIQEMLPSVKFVQMWSDSQVVLHWIHNAPAKQGIFVANRIKKIQSHGFPFRYCPTHENPADLPSRGKTASEVIDSTLWWNGPEWLKEEEPTWPVSIVSKEMTDVPEEPGVTVSNVALTLQSQNHPPFGMELKDYSSLGKLLRVTGYCKRFVDRCRRQQVEPGCLTSQELENAKQLWIAHVQHVYFQQQFQSLKSGKLDNFARQLRLINVDGILKCHGRYVNCNTIKTNDVILLSKDSYLTNLIINDLHDKMFHQGVRHTLCALRQFYWLPQGRQHVRKVLRRCLVCKFWEGPPYSLPDPPSLPSKRVAKAPAFTYTGCDFAGPLFTFDKEKTLKCYICLFTCAVTRAVHLELVNDMTTEGFLMALKRFIARRGTPRQIISDNAQTFKLAQSTIGLMWNDVTHSPDTLNYIASRAITWKFNVQRAPWWGGFFERMVGLVKRAIQKAIGKSKINTVGMATLLAEIEAILNCRPLTYVHDEPGSGHSLCPANFLSDAICFGLPTPLQQDDPDFKDDMLSATQLQLWKR